MSLITGNLPNMSDALCNYFQPMTFNLLRKTIVNFENVEVSRDVSYRGVWQPMQSRQLNMMPKGQRSWNWWTLHAEPCLQLCIDDILVHSGKNYRVMGVNDYSDYGYIEYSLVSDYK